MQPITSNQSSKLLANFIVKNFPFCPIDHTICIPECEGWGCEECRNCIQKNAGHLKSEKDILKGE